MTPKNLSLVRRLMLASILALPISSRGAPSPAIQSPGFRPLPVGVHALVGGKVVIKPGETLEGATIVIRDGYFEAVGTDVTPPADARVWEMKGLTIYAGFIEPYLVAGATNAPVSTTDSEPGGGAPFTAAGGGVNFFGAPGQRTDHGQRGPGYEVARITPEFRAVRGYSPDKKTLDPLRELGFTAAVVAPGAGIIRGSSALVMLAEENPNAVIVKPDVFQHVAFDTGVAAPRGERGEEERGYPGSLMGVIAAVRQSFFDAQHYALDHADYQNRPTGRARPEFNPSLEALAPAAGGKMRVMIEAGSALMVDRAARVAGELKLDFAVISSGQEWRRPDLLKDAGATFIVPLNFPNLPKWPSEDDWEQATLDQLRAWDWAAENPALLRQQGREIALTTHGMSDRKSFRKNLRLALDRGMSEDDALAALTTVPAKLCGVEMQLGSIEKGKIANLTIVDGKGYFDPEAKVRDVWIDGRVFRGPAEEAKKPKSEETQEAKRDDPEEGAPKKEAPKAGEKKAPEKKAPPTKATAETKKEEKPDKKAELRDAQKKRIARSPSEGRGPITNPPAVLIRNVTIWTSGVSGVLTNAQLLIHDGKIQQVGNFKAELAANTFVIDGGGKHVTPGLIDAHSHSAIVGGVNEGSLPSTAMVRIGDVVNSETGNIFEQLAGGLTTANLLHGSANPIGGQNQVIKLRDGAAPDGLKFEGAPSGIKFALGENVKQSNWGERNTTRFPQTRMGVPTFHANRFTAAQQYLQAWENSAKHGGLQPRRDLELETIGEIIQGKRWIHCHSYRQDEILAFLRTMESFGVKIGTLQHILEGYKVADEIAAHGAGASCFADWWAYKFEVYDAIPYAGSLMRDRGVLVSFNSDSSDLARHMNTEAAKAVKFGGTPEAEALKFVTINPAKQLRIDSRVGSLETGKDADFVIWSKAPLDSTAACLQTWIDGKKYFDRAQAAERATALAKERTDLIAKAKQIAKLSSGGGGDSPAAKDDGSFFRVALEHEFDGVDRHCLDEER